MTLCLNMIMRDEEHIILDMLRNIIEHVDLAAWVIEARRTWLMQNSFHPETVFEGGPGGTPCGSSGLLFFGLRHSNLSNQDGSKHSRALRVKTAPQR